MVNLVVNLGRSLKSRQNRPPNPCRGRSCLATGRGPPTATSEARSPVEPDVVHKGSPAGRSGARAKRSQSSPHPVRPTVVACAGQTGFTECFRMMGGSADSPFGMVPPAPTAVSAARVHPWALPMTKPPTVSGPWTVPFGPP